MRPNEQEAVWQVASTASVCVVPGADRAVRSKRTLLVDDCSGTWLSWPSGG